MSDKFDQTDFFSDVDKANMFPENHEYATITVEFTVPKCMLMGESFQSLNKGYKDGRKIISLIKTFLYSAKIIGFEFLNK